MDCMLRCKTQWNPDHSSSTAVKVAHRLSRRPHLRDLFSLADVRAVEVLEDVVSKAKVPLARRVIAVAVQPDLGAVGRLVAVDVEVHLGVGDGSDPAS